MYRYLFAATRKITDIQTHTQTFVNFNLADDELSDSASGCQVDQHL